MSNLQELTISVIIPTANRHSTIGKAVEGIYKNTIAPYEVIVIDQSQNDLTLKALQQFIEEKRLTYIKDEGKGISRGRNIGWRAASGNIIAFTDDDAWVDAKWLENIMISFQSNDFGSIGVVGGKVLPVYEERNPNWNIPKKWEYLLPVRDCGDSNAFFEEGEFPVGVNFITYRHLLEKFNGFDEDMGVNFSRTIQVLGEDVDYFARLKKAGFTLFYNPNCVVYHPVPMSRQTQSFLNKRLMAEGVTYAYSRIKYEELNSWSSALSASKSLFRYFFTILFKGNNEDAHYLYGKILILIKLGVFQIQP
jgi:glucosyl-dolichyl phosphate glucuronosyltransferase